MGQVNLGATPNSAVDWVTVTTQEVRAGMNWLEMFNNSRTDRNLRAKTVRMHGFVGLKIDGMIWAQREADARYMLVASGPVADQTWRRTIPTATNVTRLDLCCDVWLKIPRPTLIADHYRVPATGLLDGRMKYTLFQGLPRLQWEPSSKSCPQTLYVGSRSSDQCGRVYDKGIESSVASAGSWVRYEIETKAHRATQVARKLTNILLDGELGEAEGIIRSTVWQWFAERAVPPIFDPMADTAGITTRSVARLSSPRKKLAWLRSQVRPTVAYLLDIGLGGDMLEALGLNGRVDTNLTKDRL